MTIVEALDEVGARLQAEFGKEGIPTYRIVQEMKTRRSKESGIIPADYCYNRVNKSPSSFKHHLFKWLQRERYEYLGPHFPYTGEIWWKPGGRSERQVGKWHSGEYEICDQELLQYRPDLDLRKGQ